MAKPTVRTEAMIEAILIGLGNGRYENHLCKELGVNPATVRDWKRKDADLRENVREARCDGILTRLEVDKLALENAVTRDEILKADKCLAHSRWEAEKLLKDFQPIQKQEVSHVGPYVVGWEDDSPVVGPDKIIPDSVLDDMTRDDVAN